MNSSGMNALRGLLLAHLRTSRGAMALAALCLLGTIAAELAAPWPIKFIFDHVLLDKPLPAALSPLASLFALDVRTQVAVLAASIFALVLLGGGFSYTQMFITARIGHELTHALRRELFDRLQRMPLHRSTRGDSSEVLVKFAADTASVKDVVADWLLTLCAHFLLMVGMLAIMFIVNWRLALVVAASIPVLVLVLFKLNRRVKRALAAQRKQEGKMASRVGEMLASLKVVQAFGREQFEARRFDAASERNLADGIRTSRESAAVAKSIALVSAGATALTVLIGAHQVLAQQMTPGDLLVFMAYLRTVFKPLRDLGKLSVKFSRAMVSAQRIASVLDLEQVSADRLGAHRATDVRGEIEFRNVTFGYRRGQPVLRELNLHIRPGERVAIVGASGSGKSTIASLLARLAEPAAGSILVDGMDVCDYQRASLRDAIGVMLQDTLLFGASIRENIAYGRLDATDAQIEAAARCAYAHEFISALPRGYDTIVGQRGDTLSGGQRQRICLARAIIKQPAILILDEPTTAIDTHSARLIDSAVRRLQAGKTTIVISHQLSLLGDCDRVFVLKDGRIAAQGSRDAADSRIAPDTSPEHLLPAPPARKSA